MKSRQSLHPVAVARHATQRHVNGSDEAGFTLIELLITVVILPLVIGGICAALLAVFGLQDQTQNRISDSNDAQVGSAAFNKDVQSAEQVTTAGFATAAGCGSPTSGPSGSQTQIVGLQWGANTAASGGFETVVSYVTEQLPGEHGLALVRQECTAGQSTTPTTTTTISRDFPTTFAEQCPALPAAQTNCLSIAPATVQSAAALGWTSTQGVTGINFNITEPANQYSYTLTGLPGASTSTGAASQVQTPTSPGCSFANPNTGTYASQLCFADFTTFQDPANNCQEMQLPIENSADSLDFCVIAKPQNQVRPQSIPTYYTPGTSGYDSEAYLGNNGFYTGIPGEPALSQRPQTDPPSTFNFAGSSGPTAVYFTNVKVVNPQNQAQSGWTLVTGDAESTDTNEWLEFQNTTTPSPVDWNILPNSTSSLYGNTCYDSADPNSLGVFKWLGTGIPTDAQVGEGPSIGSNGPPSSTYATALTVGGANANYATGAAGILCEANTQLNKTGTLMVASPEPPGSSAAQNVTVTMQGNGYQAIFLGVLL